MSAPVITIQGVYTAREWTDWTQGFMYGSALLQYDATGEEWFLEYGKRNTLERMAPHLTHTGVHDHGFNMRQHLREPAAPGQRGQDCGERG